MILQKISEDVYLVQQDFKSRTMGFKTIAKVGADKAWLQECMMPHWVRGGKDEATANIASKKKNLDVIALGNSLEQEQKEFQQMLLK